MLYILEAYYLVYGVDKTRSIHNVRGNFFLTRISLIRIICDLTMEPEPSKSFILRHIRDIGPGNYLSFISRMYVTRRHIFISSCKH